MSQTCNNGVRQAKLKDELKFENNVITTESDSYTIRGRNKNQISTQRVREF